MWFTYSKYHSFINISEQSLQLINDDQVWFWIAFALGVILLIVYFSFYEGCLKQLDFI